MSAPLTSILRRHLDGDLPANVALMQMMVEAADPLDVERALVEYRAQHPAKVDALSGLLAATPGAWSTVRTVMAEADHAATAGPANWAVIFNRLARTSPEAGVALYTLGSPALLAAATDEVVRLVEAIGPVGPDRALLEIGCGYGRLSLALAPKMGRLLGLDVSAAMIDEARRRAAGLPQAEFRVTSGEDLGFVLKEAFDVVLACDVFPYLIGAGRGLGRRHVAEAARVLRPGGALLILNYSYRGDDNGDRRDAAEAFAQAGLEAERLGTRDLTLWDGRTFLARKAS